MYRFDANGQLMMLELEAAEGTGAPPKRRPGKPDSELVSIPYFHLDLVSGSVDLFGQRHWELRSPWRKGKRPLNTGAAPRIPIRVPLSGILEANPAQKYYLSKVACIGILRRAFERGKELPQKLERALRIQAGLMRPDGQPTGLEAYHINQRDEGIDLHGVSGALLATTNMQMQTFVTQPDEAVEGFDGYNGDLTADTQNAEQVSRQIRTLVPGQTIRGEVVSREGNNAQIRLLQDVLIDARVDADIRLDLGQNITFQVKNNGQVLSLSPLFTNMATEGTVLKALEMASLPTNESTVAMTKQLMDAGFPIDKNTLQQIWHESNVFPEAAIEDIVNLHRLELPVTEENLTQMASYRNLTYQLTEGITAVAESLNSTLQGLTTNGEIEQAATIYGHILELLIPGEENPEAQRATVQFPDSEQTETVLQPGETMSQTKEAIAHTDTAVTKGTPEVSKTMLPTQKMIVDGTKPEDVAEVVLKLLKQGLATKDTALLRSVLQNFKIAGLPGELLQDAWSIRPEDVESAEKVEELCQKLGKQLKSLAGLLEENGQSSSNAFQAVTNLSRNVDFLQQINQTYAYIQLPLHLRQGEHKTGELFVYTNKKNLAGKDGRVSALLHLDMEHLGPLDVYVALQDTKVSTKFYVQNDTILDYLEANMEVLTQRLKQRGYDCNCETTLRTELQQTAQAMAPILKAGGSVPVAQYAFDVRT